MDNEKRDEDGVSRADTSNNLPEKNSDSDSYDGKIENGPTIRLSDQQGDIEADARPTVVEARATADIEGGYHNFQPIAALQLGDWRKTEKRVVRILDCTLLPTLWITYLNNYLDRTNISQAMTAGLDEDLSLGEDDFNTALAMLTVGYMLAQLPSNLLLTRVRPSIYLPITVIVWSAISACTAAAKNAQTLFGIRFVLGIAEAPLFPGAVYLMSCWYTRKELALRTSILYSGLVFAQAISGLLAYGIFDGMEATAGLRGWQWLFIVEALMSVVCGLVMFITLPDYPHSRTGSQRWSMGEDEKRLAEARIEADRVTGATGQGTIMNGLKLCLKDIKLYLFTGLNLFMTASYGFNFYFPILVTGLGIVEDNTLALVFTSPPYILGAVVSALVAWNSDRMRERGWHISGGLLASAIGFVMTIASTNTFVRYAASFLFAPGSFAANALVYSWAVSSLSATPEKRAAAGAIVNIVGHIGNIVSPYFFRAPEDPIYRTAFILMLVFGALAFANAVVTKLYLKRQNLKLRKTAAETAAVYSPFTL